LVVEGEWSASHPRDKASSTHCTGGLVGPRASLYVLAKRKVPASAGNETLIVQPAA